MKNNEFLNELEQERKPLNEQNDEILNCIFEKCITVIKNINSIGKTDCVFEIPCFIIGYPLFNTENIIKPLRKKLKNKGLKSIHLESNKIFISWKKI